MCLVSENNPYSFTGAQKKQLLKRVIPLVSHKKCICGEEIALHVLFSLEECLNKAFQSPGVTTGSDSCTQLFHINFSTKCCCPRDRSCIRQRIKKQHN